ncbi:putative basic amino acid antiporter YfcC [Shewanella litorisediminis]|uniref:Basic amino acid antiporter YfcC n=1 Tax=Shewanella litorisediminis TaxID=1173586 RepID=A0ABX7G080_9GAMM|nr:putative basic amino acid antiporter YfcC [Shewanella litorisediminis]MCL2918268.1 putative basic amino acid antiporter YfcC [Shewanella litorisediminis]QRH00683.1 putative basic amino acid antiporter YfcC [Shewanella litorisediminis]
MSLSKREMPDAFIILMLMMLLAWGLTFIVPAGQFMGVAEQGIRLENFSFHRGQNLGSALFSANGAPGLLNSAFDGLTSGGRDSSAVGVVAFILIVGGAFGVLLASGAVHQALTLLIEHLKEREALLLPVLFVVFSLSGAVYGMSEEAIAFCLLLMPLFNALGYHPAVVVLVTYVATQVGFATSWMNPFSVAIAQGIAGLPLMSGAWLRALCWGVFTLCALVYTLRFARRTRRQGAQLSDEAPPGLPMMARQSTPERLGKVNAGILLILLLTLVWVIWGVVAGGYYIAQIASQFFAMAMAIGMVLWLSGQMTLNQVSGAFQRGAAELLPAALIVGFAKGLVILLGGDNPSAPSVLNTLLYGAGGSIGDLPDWLSAQMMLVFQSAFNVFVSSGSGQAALTMPLMSPLAELAGLSRQLAVLCFQLGDGLTNLIIPTSASLMGCLGVVKISFGQWLKLIWRLQLLLMTLASAAVGIAVYTGYS